MAKKKIVNSNKIYTATANIFGKTFKSTGSTIKESIGNLKPGNSKGRCILAVTDGTKRRERILMPMMAFKLFNTAGMSREIALKNVSMIFGTL